jgi:hypothetical protein
MRTAMLVLFLSAPLVLGCMSSGSVPEQNTRSDRNLITRDQLESQPSITARQVIERLHREWLRGRAGTIRSPTGRVYPKIFVNDRPYGGLDALNAFGTEDIEEIRYISASDATTRFGTGYPGGIINLILRRPPISRPPPENS